MANSRNFGIAKWSFEVVEEEYEKIGVAHKKKMKMMINMLTHLKKAMNESIQSIKNSTTFVLELDYQTLWLLRNALYLFIQCICSKNIYHLIKILVE